MVTVTYEWTVEASASFAAGFEALVLQVGAVMLNVLVLAAAPQNPGPLSNYVEKSSALAVSVGAFVTRLGVLLEPMATHATAFFTNPQTLLVALLAAPH
jgi:hypothetical protein